jgi:uncharacterized protein (TIGR03382 family)
MRIGVDYEQGWYQLEIVGYAYGTLGIGIDAGQIPAPGALGLAGLAMGAVGIRRKRAV